MRTFMIFCLSLMLSGCVLFRRTESRPGFGECGGVIRAQFLDDGRKMQLLEPYAYVDQYSKGWVAPAQREVDGASIPRVLWSLIGGPFEGKYRKASVVHDIACEDKIENSREVHEMFYNACRCSGVGKTKAKIMFAAVYHFGPKWEPDGFYQGTNAFQPTTEAEAETQLRQLAAYVQHNPDISINQITRVTPRTVEHLEPGDFTLDLREPDPQQRRSGGGTSGGARNPDPPPPPPEKPVQKAVVPRIPPALEFTNDLFRDNARRRATADSLDAFAIDYAAYSGRRVILEVNARAAPEWRETLARADEIRDYLVTRGVNAERIVIRAGYGSRKSVGVTARFE